jgi:molybdate transport system substrate-binding protein
MRRPRATLLGAVLAGALALALGGCGSGDTGDGSEADDTTLTVYAAASLTATFTELGQRFEQEHDGVTVTFSFAGSSDLVAQIQQGAPADVFASADTANMDKAVADDLLEAEPVTFASNTLRIAVPPGNPAGVRTLADLAAPGLNVVVCAPEVPCGAAATRVEEAAGVDIQPVSEESSVTDVLNKVTSGEADAGLVYVTDVVAAGDAVEGIDFPEASQAVNTYPIAVIADRPNTELAQEFVDLVTGEVGRSVLAEAGFAPPE